MRIMDVMTREVATVAPEAPLKEVAAILATHRVSGLPVVDRGGNVLGVVTEADLVAEAGESSRAARTAGEAMTSPPITIDIGRRVHEAAGLMTVHRINRLPVLNDGMLVGIVSRADVVRAFTRSDAEIQQEIVDDVIAQVLGIPREQVQVAVSGGEVTLSGGVDSEPDAELLLRLVGHVPGVVSARSTLAWADGAALT